MRQTVRQMPAIPSTNAPSLAGMLIFASIDWVAVGAVATGCAMLATATAAVYTARMAAAAKTMPKLRGTSWSYCSGRQPQAEASVEQTERTENQPRLSKGRALWAEMSFGRPATSAP